MILRAGWWCLALLPVWPVLPCVAVTPPALLLAEADRGEADVAAYLVSEKLDGVRAYWDGQQLFSRSGHRIHAPDWFTAGLPPVRLDGELWLGRGRFESLSGIVRRTLPDDDEWRQVRYMIFELPEMAGTFRERAERIRQLVAEADVPWLCEIAQISLVDRASLDRHLAAVVRAGGEGLMLHRADAPYLSGRNPALLKLKPWADAEAEVIGHLPGKGRYVNQLGALRVRTPEGRIFALGSGLSDRVRRQPPPAGTWVTYRYRDLTGRGLPRFASFLRVREE